MTARLYEVTVTVMREDFKKAFVYRFHVASPTRQKAIAIAKGATFDRYADSVNYSARCLGVSCRTEYRLLKEQQT